MKKYVSGSKLRYDMYRYFSLKQQRFTPQNWYKQCEYTDRFASLISDFAHDKLDITPQNGKAIARLIYDFTYTDLKAKYFEKLQAQVDFDVAKYVENIDKPWWKRIFNKTEKEETGYLTAKEMRNDIRRYKKLCNSQKNRRERIKLKKAEKLEAIRDTAETYASLVANGEITIKLKDAPIFLEYMNVICYPILQDCAPKQAIELVEKQIQEALDKEQEQAKKEQSTENTKTPVATSWEPVAQVEHVSHRRHHSRHHSSLWRRVRSKVKIAAVSILAVAGTALGVKNCESNYLGGSDKILTAEEIDSVLNDSTFVVKPETTAIARDTVKKENPSTLNL